MSTLIHKADTKEELLNALYGEVTLRELEESNLGVLTPHRTENKVVMTPLLPPRSQGRIASVLKRFRPTKHTGGLLFIEKIVVVFTPHIPDDAGGEVEIWVHDNMLPHLNSVGPRVRFPMSGGPRLIAFYPPYSIPLSCQVRGAPRSYFIVSEYSGVNFVAGASPFSLYIMWEPKIECVAHNYLMRPPKAMPICRHLVKDSLSSLTLTQGALKSAMSNRYATTATGLPPLTSGEQDMEVVSHPPG
uniref:Cell-to-cell movement protein n=1 Tax=Tobacco bushy top virus TaxID=184020 RepID=A0A0A7DW69_9TOMB|nr:hypothetical protein [Tobacco bushy top virus]